MSKKKNSKKDKKYINIFLSKIGVVMYIRIGKFNEDIIINQIPVNIEIQKGNDNEPTVFSAQSTEMIAQFLKLAGKYGEALINGSDERSYVEVHLRYNFNAVNKGGTTLIYKGNPKKYQCTCSTFQEKPLEQEEIDAFFATLKKIDECSPVESYIFSNSPSK